MPDPQFLQKVTPVAIRAALVAVVLAAASVPGHVRAQVSTVSYRLDIARQPLDAALNQLASQTGLQIARLNEATGRTALVGPIIGHMTVQQALESLLEHSGLTYKIINARTVAVVTDPAGDTSSKPAGDTFNAPRMRGHPKSARRLPETAADIPAPGLEEVTVTATRKEEAISKVPISVSAFTQAQLDLRGAKTFQDIVELTPGVHLAPLGSGQTVLSIRGMASTAGAATTGIYIDDTPIQVRAIGYTSGNTYPILFDLDRVELLRGPQGTLFGSGSEGGTVRFIQPQPSLTDEQIYGRAELSSIDHGGVSYEGGFAVGVPLIRDLLGLRVSAFYRRDGGWVDALTGTVTALDPSGKAGPESIGLENGSLAARNVNYDDTKLLRAVLKWVPLDGLTLGASVMEQEGYKNEAYAGFWPELSNVAQGRFATYQPTPTVDATHLPIEVPANQPQTERFLLSALNMGWSPGPIELIANLSYFKREMTQYYNAFAIEDLAEAGYLVPAPGDLSDANYINTQHNITAEVRVQPAETTGVFNWTVGSFFQRAAQLAQEGVYSNFIGQVPQFMGAVNEGPPFGTGSSAYVNWFGEAPLAGTETWYGHFESMDRQFALYGQTDYRIAAGWQATVGVRVAQDQNRFEADYAGPENNLNAPEAHACSNSSGCVPGAGVYAIDYQSGTSTATETAVTPKIGLSFQPDAAALYYLSATEGFRPGGGQIALAPFCRSGLTTLGFADGRSPESYRSDSVWSYELGSKGKWFDGLLQYAASAYLLKWRDIQSAVVVNSCFQNFTANLGGVTGRGLDLQLQLTPLRHVQVGVALSYSRSSFDARVAPGAATIYSAGSAVPATGAPLHVVTSLDTQMPLSGGLSGYFHADTFYWSAQRRSGSTDPQSVSYDPMLAPPPAVFKQNARLGLRCNGVDFSLYVNNLTNARPNLALTRFARSIDWTDLSMQPRTVGLTATFKY